MCGRTPDSAARVCWSLTTLFLITCGFILFLYGAIAPFRQNFSNLRTDGVATDRDVGLFANCDSAADDISREAAVGDTSGLAHGVINSTAIPPGFIARPTKATVDNHTLGEVSGYVRNRCERRKSPYLTLFIVTAILSLLAGWLGSLLLIHWLRSLKYLFPVLAGSSLALLVTSAMRMLDPYNHLSKYIDCSEMNGTSIDIITSQLGGICFNGLTASQQKPSIHRILSQIIPFWVGLPLLFLTLLGVSLALSWLLKRGPHHRAHESSSSTGSYGTPYGTTTSVPQAELERGRPYPTYPSSTGYGAGYGRGMATGMTRT